MCMCVYVVMEYIYGYSGGYKFWPVLLNKIIDSSGSLKKVDNNKQIKKTSNL